MTTQGDDSGREMNADRKLALGVGLGIVFGAAFGHVGLGIALGIIFGAGFGSALGRRKGSK